MTERTQAMWDDLLVRQEYEYDENGAPYSYWSRPAYLRAMFSEACNLGRIGRAEYEFVMARIARCSDRDENFDGRIA